MLLLLLLLQSIAFLSNVKRALKKRARPVTNQFSDSWIEGVHSDNQVKSRGGVGLLLVQLGVEL